MTDSSDILAQDGVGDADRCGDGGDGGDALTCLVVVASPGRQTGVGQALERQGCAVHYSLTHEVSKRVYELGPDVIVFDLTMLRNDDGAVLCAAISQSSVPLVLFEAKSAYAGELPRETFAVSRWRRVLVRRAKAVLSSDSPQELAVQIMRTVAAVPRKEVPERVDKQRQCEPASASFSSKPTKELSPDGELAQESALSDNSPSAVLCEPVAPPVSARGVNPSDAQPSNDAVPANSASGVLSDATPLPVPERAEHLPDANEGDSASGEALGAVSWEEVVLPHRSNPLAGSHRAGKADSMPDPVKSAGFVSEDALALIVANSLKTLTSSHPPALDDAPSVETELAALLCQNEFGIPGAQGDLALGDGMLSTNPPGRFASTGPDIGFGGGAVPTEGALAGPTRVSEDLSSLLEQAANGLVARELETVELPSEASNGHAVVPAELLAALDEPLVLFETMGSVSKRAVIMPDSNGEMAATPDSVIESSVSHEPTLEGEEALARRPVSSSGERTGTWETSSAAALSDAASTTSAGAARRLSSERAPRQGELSEAQSQQAHIGSSAPSAHVMGADSGQPKQAERQTEFLEDERSTASSPSVEAEQVLRATHGVFGPPELVRHMPSRYPVQSDPKVPVFSLGPTNSARSYVWQQPGAFMQEPDARFFEAAKGFVQPGSYEGENIPPTVNPRWGARREAIDQLSRRASDEPASDDGAMPDAAKSVQVLGGANERVGGASGSPRPMGRADPSPPLSPQTMSSHYLAEAGVQNRSPGLADPSELPGSPHDQKRMPVDQNPMPQVAAVVDGRKHLLGETAREFGAVASRLAARATAHAVVREETQAVPEPSVASFVATSTAASTMDVSSVAAQTVPLEPSTSLAGAREVRGVGCAGDAVEARMPNVGDSRNDGLRHAAEPVQAQVLEHRPGVEALPQQSLPQVMSDEWDGLQLLARCVTLRLTATVAFEAGGVLSRVVFRDGDFVACGSSGVDDTLLSFLVLRGDLPKHLGQELRARVAPFGRHAVAALIANGLLGQDQLWAVLRSHAEWLLGKIVMLTQGRCELEGEATGRLASEPGVFGGATGAEVLVDVVQRVVSYKQAMDRLGGLDNRIVWGPNERLLSECALPDHDRAVLQHTNACTVRDLVQRAGRPEYASLLVALHKLQVIDVLPAISPSESRSASVAHASNAEERSRSVSESIAPDVLDEQAVRQRIAARLELVQQGDYFEVLGVGRDATPYEIRRAYVEARRAFEPSRLLTAKTVDLTDDAKLIVEVLDEAYELLRDDVRRRRYLRALCALPPKG